MQPIRRNNRGLTLVEMVTVLCLLSILMTIAAMNLAGWNEHAEYTRSNSYAQSTYFAAQRALSRLQASGGAEEFLQQVVAEGQSVYQAVANPGTYEEFENRVYALEISAGSSSFSIPGGEEFLRSFLEPELADLSVLSYSIVVEVDVKAGRIYSVFLSTQAEALTYSPAPEELRGTVSMDEAGNRLESRSTSVLSELGIGYYSAEMLEDIPDNLSVKKLEITSGELHNDETLYLTWNSNSELENQDVCFFLTIRDEETEEALFTVELDGNELHQTMGDSWRTDGFWEGRMELPVSLQSEVVEETAPLYTFFVKYDGERQNITLVLDAMESAEVLETIRVQAAALSDVWEQMDDVVHKEDVSITRFGVGNQQILVEIKALPSEFAGEQEEDYISGEAFTSNAENALYATDSATTNADVHIYKWRHLSNLRYFNSEEAAEFQIMTDLDWDDAVVYGYGVNQTLTLLKEPDFPALPSLAQGMWLYGGGKMLANLRLGAGSVASYHFEMSADGESVYVGTENRAKSLAMVLENEGTISDLNLLDVQVDANGTDKGTMAVTPDFSLPNLVTVGTFCAVSKGTRSSLINLRVWTTGIDGGSRILTAVDPFQTATAGGTEGIGGIVGYLDNGLMINCEVTIQINDFANNEIKNREAGETNRSGSAVGGLAGTNNKGMIMDCQLAGSLTVRGYERVGGLVGDNRGTLEFLDSLGTASLPVSVGGSSMVGALVGDNSGVIELSSLPAVAPGVPVTSHVKVEAVSWAGGLVGRQQAKGIILGNIPSSQYYVVSEAEVVAYDGGAGGIAGWNQGEISEACYRGTLSWQKLAGEAAGTEAAVGGIAGLNQGQVKDCLVRNMSMKTEWTDGQPSLSKRWEQNLMVGGIVGQNESESGNAATVSSCFLQGSNTIQVEAGSLGGIVGYNAGTIKDCGSVSYKEAENLLKKWKDAADDTKWQKELSDWKTDHEEDDDSLRLRLTGLGSAGGIAGLNASKGEVTQCITGSTWRLSAEKGASMTSNTEGLYAWADAEDHLLFLGGVIGWNSSSQTVKDLVNMAAIDWNDWGVAGGIIGWQHGETTVRDCRNLGAVSADIKKKEYGHTLAAGILGAAMRQDTKETLEIISCENDGNIAAAQAAGILGEARDGDADIVKRSLDQCRNRGKVAATKAAAGILLGNRLRNANSKMTKCVNMGKVSKEAEPGSTTGKPAEDAIAAGLYAGKYHSVKLEHCLNIATGLTALENLVVGTEEENENLDSISSWLDTISRTALKVKKEAPPKTEESSSDTESSSDDSSNTESSSDDTSESESSSNDTSKSESSSDDTSKPESSSDDLSEPTGDNGDSSGGDNSDSSESSREPDVDPNNVRNANGNVSTAKWKTVSPVTSLESKAASGIRTTTMKTGNVKVKANRVAATVASPSEAELTRRLRYFGGADGKYTYVRLTVSAEDSIPADEQLYLVEDTLLNEKGEAVGKVILSNWAKSAEDVLKDTVLADRLASAWLDAVSKK